MKFLKQHPYLIEELENDWQGVYESLAESNIPLFLSVSNEIGNNYYEEAKEENEIIEPENNIEYYLQIVTGIYLDNLDVNNNLVLDEETKSELREIAVLNGGEYGYGVYHARGMLDTIIHTTDEYWPEERIADYISPVIKIYPNPSNGIVILDMTGNYEGAKVKVTNILGEYLYQNNEPTAYSILSLSDLDNGLYFVYLELNDIILSTEKLIIQR